MEKIKAGDLDEAIFLASCSHGVSMRAKRAIAAGTIIYSFAHLPTQEKVTYQTLQVDLGKHVIDPTFTSRLNHSCDPSVIVDTRRRVCIAARDIPDGGELNYFYPSTDWTMTDPFKCLCGASCCIGFVNGALALPLETLGRYPLNFHIVQFARELIERGSSTLLRA